MYRQIYCKRSINIERIKKVQITSPTTCSYNINILYIILLVLLLHQYCGFYRGRRTKNIKRTSPPFIGNIDCRTCKYIIIVLLNILFTSKLTGTLKLGNIVRLWQNFNISVLTTSMSGTFLNNL